MREERAEKGYSGNDKRGTLSDKRDGGREKGEMGEKERIAGRRVKGY